MSFEPISINLAGAFRALTKANHQEPITFELFSSRVVGRPREGIIGIWRNLPDDSPELAAHAIVYTRSQFRAAQDADKHAERRRLS